MLAEKQSRFEGLRFPAQLSQTEVMPGIDERVFWISDRLITGMTSGAKLLLNAGLFEVNGNQLSLVNSQADRWLNQAISELTSSGPQRATRNPSRAAFIATRRHDYLLTLVCGDLQRQPEQPVISTLLIQAHPRSAWPNNGIPKFAEDGIVSSDAWAEFNLTLTETQVARLLLEGKSVEEISAIQSISREGVRFHIKGLLSKTRCNRQPQLVAKLAKLLWNP